MSKVAVLMQQGYEESETMFVVDFLRRFGVEVTTFSLTHSLYVEGMQHITCKADALFTSNLEEYDMVFLPGGRPGGFLLKEDERVLQLLKDFDQKNKLIAAMCSGTLSLEAADVIHGRQVTGYHGYQDKLLSGEFIKEVTVTDENLITSVGPATALPMVFAMGKALGKDVDIIKEKVLYNFAGGR